MLKLYNTLTHGVEEFLPRVANFVGMYSCGPTVYDYQHIGHMRRYVGDDILIRVLQWNGYEIKHVMNITDVGHLVSDADSGEDKMEKGAKKFGLSVWDIASKFEKQFFDSTDALGIVRPDVLMHATDYIDEQIALIEVLEKKGFTYKTADGVYFDTSKFPTYFALSRQNPEKLKAGARVEVVEGKKHATDFALWKFSYPHDSSFQESVPVHLEGGRLKRSESRDSFTVEKQKRQMEWESPWGIGFPGWHIECSAMAMHELGITLDIHSGGIDHIAIHHTNEIAQAEAATGQKFVRFWVHHNFLEVMGQKMSKSLENFYTLQDVIAKKYDPMVLRYLYLQTHYRQEMNFTWESLDAAATAYKRLIKEIATLSTPGVVYDYTSGESVSHVPMDAQLEASFEKKFTEVLNDDLNTPQALAILWETIHSHLPNNEKITALSVMDNLLGLQLFQNQELRIKNQERIPEDVQELVDQRENFRAQGDFAASDELRSKIESMGFIVKDSKEGSTVIKK